jgi:hypothetical protein
MQANGGTDVMARSVAAALREIEAARTERAQGAVRTARSALAAIYGQARLARRRERETA